MATYVVSDLHGQFEVFIRGLVELEFNDDDFLYVIGDAIDRGPEGVSILNYVRTHDNMDLLIGNHEFMMLNSVDLSGGANCNGKDAMLWLYANGGGATLAEYETLSDEERRELLAWLKDRFLIKTIACGGKKICLTHSYYKPDCENKRYRELSYQEVSFIVWSSIWRDDEMTHADDIYGDYDYTFITGHVPVQRVFYKFMPQGDYNRLEKVVHGNLINIDGGLASGHSRGLHNGAIFLRLDDMKEFPVSI